MNCTLEQPPTVPANKVRFTRRGRGFSRVSRSRARSRSGWSRAHVDRDGHGAYAAATAQGRRDEALRPEAQGHGRNQGRRLHQRQRQDGREDHGAELQDKDGKTLVSVAGDGSVTIQGAQHGAKFWIGDNGALNLIDEKGQKDKDSGKLKFAGFKPEGRRAALVFFLGMMMPTSVSVSGPASA